MIVFDFVVTQRVNLKVFVVRKATDSVIMEYTSFTQLTHNIHIKIIIIAIGSYFLR